MPSTARTQCASAGGRSEPARWATGDATGLRIPVDADALRASGTRLLTEAFHRFGALTQDNRVVAITEFAEVDAGSTGRKLLLSVDCLEPGPPPDLFVKFSRDLDNPERDRGRTQMEPEVAFAALAARDGFPITVPKVLFADYHDGSGTGVLITERIPFGANGIEGQYAKCMDYDMPYQLGHYRALLDAGRLLRRFERLADFATTHPGCCPTISAHRRSSHGCPRCCRVCWSTSRASGTSCGVRRTSSRCVTGTPMSTTRGSGVTGPPRRWA